jgi:ABC-type multidrug transport system fused ATPase/permease subunit
MKDNIAKVKSRLNLSAVGRAAGTLEKKDKKKVGFVIVIQMLLGGLDLAGVAVVGVLGALAVSGIGSNTPGNRVNSVLAFLNLESAEFQTQVAILGSLATVLLVGRTLLSVFFTRRILYFLSRKGAQLSASLISKLLSQPLNVIQSRSSQETLFALTYGVSTVLIGIIGSFVTLVSDVSLLVIMGVGLFIVDPVIAISTFVIFAIIGFILYKIMNVKVKKLGKRDSALNIQSNERIIEVLSSYRELTVRNRRDFYSKIIGDIRYDLANTQAELAFMPNVSKYVIETTVVLGALFISAFQFLLQDATHAVATLAIFLAAGTRIAPAILRVQQGAIQMKGSAAAASATFDLMQILSNCEYSNNKIQALQTEHVGFDARVIVKNVSMTYAENSAPSVSKIDLEIEPGKILAIVGPSGAGKTTIVDLILGVLEPDSGTITISSLAPQDAISKWPGAIAYVPQDVVIANGTIRENIAIGFSREEATDELIWEALETANLANFVKDLTFGIDTPVGERGAKISGGQRQRLGIARAMFTRPQFLVLDEATSALDGETELNVSDAIQGLRGTVTVIIIAHRLSTVRNADRLAYLENGNILAIGTFNEVRELIPDFDRQATLMGL